MKRAGEHLETRTGHDAAEAPQERQEGAPSSRELIDYRLQRQRVDRLERRVRELETALEAVNAALRRIQKEGRDL